MEFIDVINARHSVRKYAETPVERETIDRIISVAQTAPSSKNSKSTGFMVIEDPDTLAAISEMRDHGSALIRDARAAIVIIGDTTKTDLWVENCSISSTFVQLAATDLGLGSCWVHVHGRPRVRGNEDSGLAEDYIRDLLGIKPEFGVLCVIALGYPQE